MIKKYGLFLLILAAVSVPAFAEEGDSTESAPSVSVDVTGAVVSNYVWRGYDVFSGYAEQKGKQYGSNTGTFAFQPDVTINLPVEGLYVDLWGSFAMRGREDVDSDRAFQYAPGGDDILTSTGALSATGLASNAGELMLADIEEQRQSMLGCGLEAHFSGDTGSCATTKSGAYRGGVPGYYAEENGLKRVDEVDFMAGYAADSDLGSFDFGVVAYLYPNSIGGVGAADKELYLVYGVPGVDGLSVGAYYNIDTSGQYYQLAYEGGVELGKDMTLDYGVNAAYSIDSNIEAFHDAGASVGMSIGGFSFGVNMVHRMDSRFYDDDAAPDSLPVYLEGGSTNNDGMVADPSKTQGMANLLINSTIQSSIDAALPEGSLAYTYTPRQKLPKNLYWVSASYTYTFE